MLGLIRDFFDSNPRFYDLMLTDESQSANHIENMVKSQGSLGLYLGVSMSVILVKMEKGC